jgi:hypothetical protein
MNYESIQQQIRHEILNRYASQITPGDATQMAQAAVDILRNKNTKTKEETEDLTDVLAAGKYIARRDAEALRLLAQ